MGSRIQKWGTLPKRTLLSFSESDPPVVVGAALARIIDILVAASSHLTRCAYILGAESIASDAGLLTPSSRHAALPRVSVFTAAAVFCLIKQDKGLTDWAAALGTGWKRDGSFRVTLN